MLTGYFPSNETLIWLTGPPGAGKSTLAHALAQEFERTLVIPVDTIREWVERGFAGPIPWTDETERQYRLGEEAACLVAGRYLAAEFAVTIDACRNPRRIDELLLQFFPSLEVMKILLLPSLEENLRRAHSRTNKAFDSAWLDPVIASTHAAYEEDAGEGWHVLDTTQMALTDELDWIRSLRKRGKFRGSRDDFRGSSGNLIKRFINCLTARYAPSIGMNGTV